jgi:hypothetical protein
MPIDKILNKDYNKVGIEMEIKNMVDNYINYQHNFNNIKKKFENKIVKNEYSLGSWLYYDIYNDPEMLIYKTENDIKPKLIKKKNNIWEKGLYVYCFDNKNNIIEIKIDSGFGKDLYLYLFNNFCNNKIECIEFDPSGILINIQYYFFDNINILNKKYQVALDGCEVFFFKENKYYYKNGKIEKIIIREYNEKNEEGISELLFEYNQNNKLSIKKTTQSILYINKGLLL